MAETILQARNLKMIFRSGGKDLVVFDQLNLDIRQGEIIAIVGPSGVGKTTLLQVLGLLEKPSEGNIYYQGKSLGKLSGNAKAKVRNKEFSFVFQSSYLLPDLTALRNVMVPGMIANGFFRWISLRGKLKARAKKLLADVGLTDRMGHVPAKLSGGEKQRVVIARALAQNPKIVFCDEPTGSLDVRTSNEIHSLLWELNRKYQTTFVLVTHDLSIASKADRILALGPGGSLEEISSADVQKVFTIRKLD